MHRGPDDSGSFSDVSNEIGLARTRLSILDLSPLGHQPMASEDGLVVLTYNGATFGNFVLNSRALVPVFEASRTPKYSSRYTFGMGRRCWKS